MSDLTPDEVKRRVELAKNGDEESLAWLIEQTQRKLFRFCVYLAGNRQLAQDLCQDVYIKVLESLKTLENGAAFESWLFRTARNLFLDHVKSPRNKPQGGMDDQGEIEASLPEREQVLAIRQALGRLEPEDRVVLLLVDLEGHTYAEAAAAMECTEAAVRSRLHRARQDFAKKFQHDETNPDTDSSSRRRETKR